MPPPASARPPRILLLNQFYWPDGAPTGVLLDDVARELAKRGCDVTVICGETTYLAQTGGDPPPVRIVRVPALPYSRGPVGRMLSWLSFLAAAVVRAIAAPKFDLVVALTSPPGIAVAGVFLKLLKGSRLWIWEMDLYPDVAVALGVIAPTSLAARISRFVFTAIRRYADGIIALGDCMRDRLVRHGLPAQKIAVAENWARSSVIQPAEQPPMPPLEILYSGNLGMAHDIQTMAQVMLRLRDRRDIHFTISGGGERRAELEKFCSENRIGNVSFRGYVNEKILSQSLGNSHLCLVTLRPECLGCVVPSKVYSILAASRPYIYIGPLAATPASLATLQGCGWAFEAGDVDGVIAQLSAILDNPRLLTEACTRSAVLFQMNYDVTHGASRICDILYASPITEL